MRFRLIAPLIAALAALFLPLTVQAAPLRQMEQSYTINIVVDCLDEAVAILRGLPGNDLQANIGMRSANFTRRVDNHFFRHVQEVLREMGEVTHESEWARHLSDELASLEVRIRVATQEIERLTAIMAASTTLDVLIAVDSQLSWATWQRSQLIGRQNLLQNHALTTLLTINLTAYWAHEPPVEEGFGERIAAAFASSWQGMGRVGANVLVVTVRSALPVAIWAFIAALGILIILRKVKKYKQNAVSQVIEIPTAEGESDYVK